MPAPNDLNSRIALAKGWAWDEELLKALWFGYLGRPLPKFTPLTHWHNPEGKPAVRPDFVGTLRGVSGMLRELGNEWQYGACILGFACFRGLHAGPDEFFTSPDDCPGHCVGEAWMSVHGTWEGDDRCQEVSDQE